MSDRDELVLMAIAGKRATSKGWVRGNCPWCELVTGAPDRSLALGVNLVSGEWHCLAGETSILTWNGYAPVSSLVGQTSRVLTMGKKRTRWVDVVFQSYGRQKLTEVHISRNGVRRILRATPEHRWFVSKQCGGWSERVTSDLRPGDRLQHATLPRSPTIVPSPWGVAHGVTFGDGHLLGRASAGARAVLYGQKDSALARFFPLSRKRPGRGDVVEIDGLPRFFKALPDIDESASYLYGWLAGYFAADGCVSEDGNVTLASAKRENLVFVRNVAIRLGLDAREIKVQYRRGFGATDTPLYSLTFGRGSLTEAFFLLDKHRTRWLANNNVRERHGWIVERVVSTDVVEEVFCTEVPSTHNFVLEGNIVTGNCFRCHSRGLIQMADGVLLEDVVTTQAPARQAKPEEEVRMELPEGFVSLYEGPDSRSMACAAARSYLQQRGVPAEVGRAAKIGAVFGGWLGGRVVVPIFEVDGSVAGWSARLWKPAPPDVPKYLYPSGMDRANLVYNAAALHVQKLDPVFVVEGVFDALSLWPDAIACLGKPSQGQIARIVAACLETGRPVVAMLDGDAWREAVSLARTIKRRGVRAAAVRLQPKQDPGGTAGVVLREMAQKALDEV